MNSSSSHPEHHFVITLLQILSLKFQIRLLLLKESVSPARTGGSPQMIPKVRKVGCCRAEAHHRFLEHRKHPPAAPCVLRVMVRQLRREEWTCTIDLLPVLNWLPVGPLLLPRLPQASTRHKARTHMPRSDCRPSEGQEP